jgi:hypothetical protein
MGNILGKTPPWIDNVSLEHLIISDITILINPSDSLEWKVKKSTSVNTVRTFFSSNRPSQYYGLIYQIEELYRSELS